MNNCKKDELREDMNFLHGQLMAIRFPLMWKSEHESQAYYDLIDSITEQYEKIKEKVLESD